MTRAIELVIVAAALVAATSVSASPIFEGTASNAWVFEDGEPAPATYFAGNGDRTLSAVPSGFDMRVRYGPTPADNEILPGVSPGDHMVLVNRANAGWQPTGPRIPPLSLTGLDLALFTAGNNHKPKVALTPAPGVYTETIRVKLASIAAPAGVGMVRIYWQYNGGPVQSTLDREVTITLVSDGVHELTYWAKQGFQTTGSATVEFTIAAADGPARDADGDGVPDVVEDAFGTDPLETDFDVDTDEDGWSDFDEGIRGTDPSDPLDHPQVPGHDVDGDGWPDVDEVARGTDVNDDHAYPSVISVYQREVVTTVTVFEDGAQTTPLGGAGAIEAMTLLWEDLPARGSDGSELPFELDAVVETPTPLMGLPMIRTPAERPIVFRVRAYDEANEGTPWVAKAYGDMIPDLRPEEATAWLAANDPGWDTPSQWVAAYRQVMADTLVQNRAVAISPYSGLSVALMEALAAWHAGLTDGAMVLFANPAGDMPIDAVLALDAAYGTLLADPATGIPPSDALNRLHAAMEMLVAEEASLDGLRLEADAIWTDGTELEHSTTTRELASLVQHDDVGIGRQARYWSRVVSLISPDALAEMPQDIIDDLFDPDLDFDGDGLTNGEEVLVDAPDALDIVNPDTDGDDVEDGDDDCPLDDLNQCRLHASLNADTDGDGLIDALDNCLNAANPDQADGNADGIGDACVRFANIRQPIAHLDVPTGTTLTFESLVTELGLGLSITYLWDFGGAAPNSIEAQPGDIAFLLPGVYTIQFFAFAQMQPALPPDVRTITVFGPPQGEPVVDIIAPPSVVEGTPAPFFADASSPNGDILAWEWAFGDGELGDGALVDHTYLAEGVVTISVLVTDEFGEQGTDELDLVVLDAEPVPAFSFAATPGDLEFQFTDETASFDAVASWSWDFGDLTLPSSEPHPVHAFPAPGIYTVTLTVHDADGSVAAIALDVPVEGSGIQLDELIVSSAWKPFAYPHTALDPIVIIGPPTTADGEAGVVQLRGIDGDGFEARFAEWDNEDGPHPDEAAPFLVIERGRHVMADGAIWEAGTFVIDHAEDFVAQLYEQPYAKRPSVFLTIQTSVDPSPTMARLWKVGKLGFRAAIVEEEANAGSGHLPEEVGFLAVYRSGDSGTLPINGAAGPWSRVQNILTHAPIAIGGCTLYLDEDTSADAETLHLVEKANVLTLQGQCFANPFSRFEDDPFTVRRN